MNHKKHDFRRHASAKDKLNAVAVRGSFIFGAVAWAVTGEFMVGVLAATLAVTACYIGGELR